MGDSASFRQEKEEEIVITEFDKNLGPIAMTLPMEGKVVLITGANSGIGKAAALALAKMGADLVLLCRNRGKAATVREEIIASSDSKVDLIVADMLLQREVRRSAAEFLSIRTKLDVLLNNAGADITTYQETEDGVERTMALNYFSHFLLTNLLLEELKRSAPSRIVNVSSVGYYGASLDLRDINGKGKMGTGGLGAYGRSKLALILFTYELSRRLQGSGVTANCLHPGAVRTNIWSHAGVFTPITRLASLFMLSPEKGARTSIYLASSPDVKGITGKYFDNCKPKPSSPESYDEEEAAKLWEISERMTAAR